MVSARSSRTSGKLGWDPDFWAIFPISLMGMIAFWSTLSLNMPDFTRFGRSQRDQTVGQAVGLPTTMTLFPLVGVITTSATVIVFGKAIWDPVALTGELDNPIALIVMLAAIALATLTTNVAANVVSPSYDFSNAWPKRISFRTGGIITGIIGVLIMPWKLLADPNAYIWTWLGTYGGATGPIAGVLIADYWWVRRKNLKLADLYRVRRRLRVRQGLELDRRGVARARDRDRHRRRVLDRRTGKPFPANGIIPFLKPFYDYSWAVGLAVAVRDLRRADAHRGQEARHGPDRGFGRGNAGRLIHRPAPPAHLNRAATRGPSTGGASPRVREGLPRRC